HDEIAGREGKSLRSAQRGNSSSPLPRRQCLHSDRDVFVRHTKHLRDTGQVADLIGGQVAVTPCHRRHRCKILTAYEMLPVSVRDASVSFGNSYATCLAV